ncbi:MAG TPA: CapA family protein [Bacteroidales bacterium]|jgi:poly-gamma-glutamate synthesis protein (capsule biosynthesis protein)|nr:CapA family protein [Bacteroidales bacterium]
MRYVVILLLTLFYIPIYSQSNDTSRLKLVFAGDIMGHDEQIAGAWNSETGIYDYEPTFRYIKPYIEQADIAIGNLEVTLAGPPYKGYPQFSSPDALASAASEAGFDIFIQANNHALDRGTKGFKRTIRVLDSLNIIHTGTFVDSVDRYLNYPLIIEKNSIRIALLNYTYGTNGIKIGKPSIINYIDTASIRADLNKAKLANPDFTIITVHWGEEYQRTENVNQQRLAKFMLKHGADAIIGSHPHVIQPIKQYSSPDSSLNHLVVFSQGNFVSNQRAQYKDGGILVEMNLLKVSDSTSLEAHSYMPAWVYRDDQPGKSTFYVVPVSFYESNASHFNLKDHDRYKISQFATDTRENLKGIKENGYFKAR